MCAGVWGCVCGGEWEGLGSCGAKVQGRSIPQQQKPSSASPQTPPTTKLDPPLVVVHDGGDDVGQRIPGRTRGGDRPPHACRGVVCSALLLHGYGCEVC